jgi:Abortive infection C-terminus
MTIDENIIAKGSLERIAALEDVLVGRATGDLTVSNEVYDSLRREFIANPVTKNLLPEFVKTCRSLDVFWPYIKAQAGSYAERRLLISQAFTPMVEYFEKRNSIPSDNSVSKTLSTFDQNGVHAIWLKALDRRDTDPEGAITVARTLLETLCKRILDERAIPYTDKEDLPKLYSMVAKSLSLAPDQHSEEPIKAILGGAMNLVNGIGTLRNRLSDSHGRGGKPVKPAARHASLAINMAGALAVFLVETHLEKHAKA